VGRFRKYIVATVLLLATAGAAWWIVRRPARPIKAPPNPSPIAENAAIDSDEAPPVADWNQSVSTAMAGRPGVAVVVERKTGRILATNNRALAERMAALPGSTLKPFALWALLDAHRLGANESLLCPHALPIAGRNFACTHPALANPMTAETALAYSCNNFVAHFAARFHDGELAEFLRAHGFSYVTPALGPDRIRMQALGAADARVTPLELARGYAKLADTAPNVVQQGLRSAVLYGTGQLAGGTGLSGKTGTAEGRAWFAGFTRDVAVVVAVPGASGGGDAAPIAKEIVAPGGVWVGFEKRGSPPLRTYMRMEEYVATALAGECADLRSDEALKAMAVAIRTYAARFRHRHASEGFDLCDTTHCQRLRADAVNGRLLRAARDTAGELLWYEGAPAHTYYSQDCGGVTEAAAVVWPDEAHAYLTSVKDSFCTRQGRAGWQCAVSPAALRTALSKAGLSAPARIDDVTVSQRTDSGRASEIRLRGEGGEVRLAATSLRFAVGRALGWDSLRSTLFDVRREGAQFVFHGYGAGHGVGLCQKGAGVMGAEGRSYRDILAFYYPGTTVGQSAQSFAWRKLNGERVELWTTSPGRDQHLVPIADAALGQAEEITSMRARLRPLVRVYPTVTAFRNATGETGQVAGDERGRVIRLQPDPALQTVLHEMLHFVLEANTRPDVPRWFREGLAALLAGDREVPERMGDLSAHHSRAEMLGWLKAGLPAGL
jgi:stage II sporulation protein D